MSTTPFVTVASYGAMLNRIAVFTFFVSLGCTAVLRAGVPEINSWLASLSIDILTWANVPFGTVAPALIVALLSRIFKLHDRISDLLSIRHRFDISHILFPLALGSGATMNVDKVKKVRSHRSDLMAATFYAYASSDPTKTVIDKHKVEMALDMWGWYWVLVEGNAIALVTAGILLIAGKTGWAAIVLIAVLISLWVLQSIKASCSKYALAEVAAILEDQGRREKVAQAFNAL